ncbi:TPA: hypothetical protein DCZ15_02055 [Candidatus Falkowbacteria bacterium]|nr:MAG: hypothetical protein UV95_C0001G0195 [Candidatus Falkowbacteria bacterium GW2011_GWF2_43_32]HBA36638.1 hypothetical protein [Candidatus Falkowbacteria bacterium]
MRKINSKKLLAFSLPLILVAGIFLFGPSVSATAADWAGEMVGSIINIFISALGLILILVIKVLISIAGYQHFIDSQVVVLGWVIVRDICNMFFIVILMIIAFGTILHLENYSYKKWLPKLVLMAILINFSKTICGLLIDVAQVVMITFVNAFKDVGGANMTDILGIDGIVTMAKGSADLGFWAIVGAYVLGLIYMIVALIVITTMMMILVMRLVMIWIYVVLSPLAYLLSAFPGGEKYASQWWSEFTKNLIVGPVLAFFIWLSFAALQTGNSINTAQLADISGATITDETAAIIQGAELDSSATSSAALAGTQASTPGALIKFVIAIGMLIGGLKISQDIGGQAGSLAGKGMEALNKGKSMALSGVKSVAKQPFSWGADKLHEKTGVDLNLKRSWGVVQAKRKENQEKRYGRGVLAARKAMEEGGRVHGALAMTGNAGDAWDQVTTWKGIVKRVKGGKRMQKLKDEGLQGERQAKMDKSRYEFEEKWANTDPNKKDANGVNERTKLVQEVENKRDKIAGDIKGSRNRIDVIDKELEAEKKKDPRVQDTGKIEALEKERLQNEGRISDLRKSGEELKPVQQFIKQVQDKSQERKVYSDKDKEEILANKKEADVNAAKAKKKIERNIPEYSFEARAMEQKLVSQESSKIHDITDPTELGRILKDAIKSHDTTMVKAITLKMTKDGNDNEFLQPLAGRTDHIGLKDLMRQFSDKKSDNYAGFSQQEGFSLGSQIAELNKATSHWAATSAYVMENGQWRETTDLEHNDIMTTESGKRQQEECIRKDNRLAYGYHDKEGKFHLNVGGVLKLQSMDNAHGHGRMNTMNESAAKYCYEAIKANPKLETEFSKINKDSNKSLLDVLETRLGNLAGKGKGDIEPRYSHVVNDLGVN